MEATNNPFKEAIANYLRELAHSDKQFANTLVKPNKNIHDCATYILNEVKKSGRQGFDDDEIYKMAIHYYDQDSIEIGVQISARVVVNHALATPTPKSITPVKSSTKTVNLNQTSLF